MPPQPVIQHFVITRFNLRIKAYERDKKGGKVRDDGWLRDRLDLFNRYCFPSMLHQTEQRFTWLLLVDQDSSPQLLAELARLRGRMPNLELVPMPEIVDQAELAQPVLQRLAPDADLLVTTRLDNDDALHQEALRSIRERARARREFLNLRLGYETDGRMAAVVSHKYGHFSSLVEPRDGSPIRTVHHGLMHGRAHQIAPVRQIQHQPLWLRVIHERNLANELTSRKRTAKGGSPLRQAHRALRRLGAGLRTRFWPKEYRQPRPLADIAPFFHIAPLPWESAPPQS